MRKNKLLILTAAFGLAVSGCANTDGVYRQAPLRAPGEEVGLGAESFDSSDYSSGQNYQGTVTEGPEGGKWTIYYGCFSTSSVITGTRSAAIRLYTSANYGYLKTDFPTSYVSKVVFKAKAATSYSAAIKMNVEYSTDNSSWSYMKQTSDSGDDYHAVQPGVSASSITAYMPTAVKGNQENVYLKWSIDSSSTRPSSKNAQLTIDDINIYYTEQATKTLSDIELSGTYPTSFIQGDAFSHEGMVVTAKYSDADDEDVTSKANWSEPDMSTAGNGKIVTVSYSEGDITKTAEYTINVAPATLYTIDGTVTNGSLSSTASIRENDPLSINVVAEEKCALPDEIEVVMGGNTLTVDADYLYDPDDGSIYIAHVTGHVVINAVCSKIKGLWSDVPYTVAEARAAIDAGEGVTGVYATGIVSEIVTAYNSTYGNISYNISADGDTEGNQLQAFRGKSFDGDNFTSAYDVLVGATVVIFGNLKNYKGTYEFDADNQLVSYTEPDKVLDSIVLSGTYPTEFHVGDAFSHDGMTVTAKYVVHQDADVTASATFEGYDMSSEGEQTVTVSYTEGTVTKTATYTINVKPVVVSYSVTNSVSHATLSSSSNVDENTPLNITIIPELHWILPEELTVTMGGNSLSVNTGYTYNNSTGAFAIASVTGNVVITGECTPEPSYTITYVAGNHGTGSDHVVTDVYAGSYTLVDYATTGFETNSGYVFDKWEISGVEYAAGAQVTISGNTTVTAKYLEINDYSLFDGDIVEGDYVIYYNGKVLKNTISAQNRADYSVVSPVNDVITTSDVNIVWHIDSHNGNYTIYNAAVSKYLASTGADNKAALVDDITDKAVWTITETNDGYEIENVSNKQNKKNSLLRNNGTYGFACYSNSTGGALSLYKKANQYDHISSVESISKLSVVKDGDDIKSVAMKLGASISETDWNAINSKWEISAYGVMFVAKSKLDDAGCVSVKDAYKESIATVVSKALGDAVPENGHFKFTATINYKNDTYYNNEVYAAPFIIAGGQYIFLTEIHTSVKLLADEYLAAHDYSAISEADLNILAGN